MELEEKREAIADLVGALIKIGTFPTVITADQITFAQGSFAGDELVEWLVLANQYGFYAVVDGQIVSNSTRVRIVFRHREEE